MAHEANKNSTQFLVSKTHVVPHYDNHQVDCYVTATDGEWEGEIYVESEAEFEEAKKELMRQYMQRFDKPNASLQ